MWSVSHFMLEPKSNVGSTALCCVQCILRHIMTSLERLSSSLSVLPCSFLTSISVLLLSHLHQALLHMLLLFDLDGILEAGLNNWKTATNNTALSIQGSMRQERMTSHTDNLLWYQIRIHLRRKNRWVVLKVILHAASTTKNLWVYKKFEALQNLKKIMLTLCTRKLFICHCLLTRKLVWGQSGKRCLASPRACQQSDLLR